MGTSWTFKQCKYLNVPLKYTMGVSDWTRWQYKQYIVQRLVTTWISEKSKSSVSIVETLVSLSLYGKDGKQSKS